jgi:hypothetical protein
MHIHQIDWSKIDEDKNLSRYYEIMDVGKLNSV